MYDCHGFLMKGRLLVTFVAGCWLLAGCVLPPEFASILPFIPTITRYTVAYTVTASPGPASLTPFQPEENSSTSTTTPFQPVENTGTYTPSATATLTLTLTSTETATPSLTRTRTQTRSPTITPTASRTITVSSTPIFPYTATQIWIPSYTPTSTQTSLAYPTPSYTPTLRFTDSPYLSPTFTLYPSITVTSTSSFTPTVTPTPTNTRTPGSIPTPTATRTGCNPVYNSGYEDQIVSLINQTRSANGLPLLTVHSALMNSAREHSTDMAVNNYVSHTGSDGSTSWQRMQRAGYVGLWGGENIYGGYNTSPAEAYAWWMNSTPHRENILGQYYRDVGVGYAYCNNSAYRNAYSINFGAP